MAILESCPKHNMVAYLEKTNGNAEFHKIINFLARSSINYALTISPVISTTFVEQFWTSAKSQTINNVRYIKAKVAGKPITISKASIQSDLCFDDANGIDSLNNHAIFDAIKLMGSKSTSWDQIPSNIATVLKNVHVPSDHFPINVLTKDKGEGSERPSEPQPTPSSPYPSEPHVEPQSNPSPRPSPTIPITDPILEGSGGKLGTQVAEIKSLKAQVKRLKKQARPFILHHKAWLKTVKRKNQDKEKVLKTSKRRSIFKQGRKTVNSSKGAPTVPTNTKWDDLDIDIDDIMDYTLAQDEGTAQQQSTDRQDEGTDMPKVSTDRTKLSTDKVEKGTTEPELRESTSSAAQTTPTPTPTTFGDDETIAQVLLNMSQAKAIDPNDKGKKRIKEDEESDTESEEITEAKKKFDQIAHDEEVARKVQEEWEAEEERKRLTEEEATKTALSNEYDFIQARIKADRLLAEKVQEAEREEFIYRGRESKISS
ncbi:hypothetical protein Tco_0088331 [Tanacetum coccineum]